VERHNEALNIYAQLIEQLKGKKRFEALATIYSNAINFIVKCNLHEYEDLLKTAIEELHNIIYSTTFAMKEYYNHFSNLGQGRWYFKQYESAIPCFCKAFDILGDDPTHEKEVNLLIECYPCFLTVGDDDFIVTRMLNLNIHKMKGEVKLTYLKLLAKVRVTINPSITSKSLLDTLDEYIIKL